MAHGHETVHLQEVRACGQLETTQPDATTQPYQPVQEDPVCQQVAQRSILEDFRLHKHVDVQSREGRTAVERNGQGTEQVVRAIEQQ